MKTYSMKRDEIQKDWLVFDAAGVPLGRLATQVAIHLRGKHKPAFTPHLDMGDNVIVVNARDVKLTGLKREKKVLRHHTHYMGGLKTVPVRTLMVTRPERVVMHAVRGMLPKNRLGRKLLTNLRVYGGPEHPHAAQQPRTMEITG
ncbi:MAG: 50S ribosomal protein L13 [Candidatus Krumholzibacteriia bacterium]